MAAYTDNSADGGEDVETEAIVILVSHGAGCNALIGAITHQPVLMDVGMASLTMAVRKPSIDGPSSLWEPRKPLAVHELYDLQLFANTDHLRSPATTPTIARTSAMAGAMNGIRTRHSSFSTSGNGFSWNDSGSRSPSASKTWDGFRKSSTNDSPVPRLNFAVSTGGITVGSGVTSFSATRPSNLGRTGSSSRSGLWSPMVEDEEDDDIPVLNFGGYAKPDASTGTGTSTPTPAPASKPSTPASIGQGSTGLSIDTNPGSEPVGAGTSGLWGAPQPPDDADRFRDFSGFKRRWTVTERS